MTTFQDNLRYQSPLGPTQAQDPVGRRLSVLLSDQQNARPLGPSITPGVASPLGTRLRQPRQVPGGYAAIFEQSNLIAGAAGAIDRYLADSAAGSRPDDSFDSRKQLDALSGYTSLSSEEQEYLLGSNSQRQFSSRATEIGRERLQLRAMAGVGVGEGLLVGLVGAALDPTSYIPIAGQGSKAITLYRNADRMLRAGRTVGRARLAMQLAEGGRGLWRGALEGATIEAGIQAIQVNSRVNRGLYAEQALPSIAITGAFSGVLTGAFRTLGTRRAAGQVVPRAEARRANVFARARELRGGLNLEDSLAFERGDFGSLVRQQGPLPRTFGTVGTLPGVLARRGEAERRLADHLIKLGVASDLDDAMPAARLLLSEDPAWISPASTTAADFNVDEAVIRAMADLRQAEIRAGQILSDTADAIEIDTRTVVEARRTLQSDKLFEQARERAQAELAEAQRRADAARGGRISGLSRRLKKAKDPGERRRLEQEIEALRAEPARPVLGHEQAVADATARTANRPVAAEPAVSPAEVASSPRSRNASRKAAAVRADAARITRDAAQGEADALNAQANWASAFYQMLGNGTVPMRLVDGKWEGVFMASAGDIPKPFSVRIAEGKLGKKLAVYSDGLIRVDPDAVRSAWNTNAAGIPMLRGSRIERLRPSDVASTPEEFMDFVVMHELVHDTVPRTKGKGVLYDEALTNKLVEDWKQAMRDPGPEDRPDVRYFAFDAGEPMAQSVPVQAGVKPAAAIEAAYRADGNTPLMARVATKWLRFWNPAAKAASSPVSSLRIWTKHLMETPLYYTDDQPVTAMQAVKLRMVAPKRLYEDVGKEFRRLRRETGDRSVTLQNVWDRAGEAMAKGDKDAAKDGYSPLVDAIAKRIRRDFDRMKEEGKPLGIAENEVMPPGETYYRRLYNPTAVNSDDFIRLVARYVDPESLELMRRLPENRGATAETIAYRIQGAILHNTENLPPVDAAGRGAFDNARGSIMGQIPFDELKPFLKTDGFEMYYNAVKVFGGEIELRRAALAAADEMGVPREALMDGEEWKGFDAIEKAISAEADQVVAGEALTRENVSAAYKADWGEGTALAQKYPERASVYGKYTDDILHLDASPAALRREGEFARSYFKDTLGIVRGTLDIPSDPDSVLRTRLPRFIRDYTRITTSGKVAIANIADMARSVVEYGLGSTFRNEWSILVRDLDAFNKRKAWTKESGLAMAHVHNDIHKYLFDVNEHLDGRSDGFSRLERGATKGAAIMQRLNGMVWLTNRHQQLISSGVQGFLLDNLEAFARGEADAATTRRIKRLNIDVRTANRLVEAMNAGGRKKAAGGYDYFDADYDWPAGLKERLAAAIEKGAYISQAMPSRSELMSWQVSPWGSVLMMYRSWLFAVNSRLSAAAISNPDKALMTGLMAAVGAGAIVTYLKAFVAGRDAPQGAELARAAIDNGGYLGLIGELHNIQARITGGTTDLLPGEGFTRYYRSDTGVEALVGPAWKYPQFGVGLYDTARTLEPPDRTDVQRLRGMLPYNQLYWHNWMFDKTDEANP